MNLENKGVSHAPVADRSGSTPNMGYLEPGAPPGYLLLKSRSDPDNFVRRCRDLGFEVYPL